MMKKSVFIILLCCLLALCSCGKTAGKTVVSDDNETKSTSRGETAESVGGNTGYDIIDVDISSMSGTMAYSQVYDMLCNPSGYVGKTVKMSGPFSVFYSEETTLYYPAVIIRDATACCAQGLEFVLSGNPAYPSGYPEANSEITVVGIFETYNEGSDLYCHLVNAVII